MRAASRGRSTVFTACTLCRAYSGKNLNLSSGTCSHLFPPLRKYREKEGAIDLQRHLSRVLIWPLIYVWRKGRPKKQTAQKAHRDSRFSQMGDADLQAASLIAYIARFRKPLLHTRKNDAKSPIHKHLLRAGAWLSTRLTARDTYNHCVLTARDTYNHCVLTGAH